MGLKGHFEIKIFLNCSKRIWPDFFPLFCHIGQMWFIWLMTGFILMIMNRNILMNHKKQEPAYIKETSTNPPIPSPSQSESNASFPKYAPNQREYGYSHLHLIHIPYIQHIAIRNFPSLHRVETGNKLIALFSCGSDAPCILLK
mgnify:CR=1 FL=1